MILKALHGSGRRWPYSAWSTLLLFAGACAGNSPHALPPVSPEIHPSFLQPGDAIRLEIFREAEISRDYLIDERGKVVFPLIGETNVGGYSPDSLRIVLVSAFNEYLREPAIQITMLRRVNILGQVRNPGLYSVDATMSVADALALAGGVAPAGNTSDIRLIRSGSIVRQNLSQAAQVGYSPIQSGDQILVGERSWFSRNAPIVSSFIAAIAITTAALVR